MNIVSFISFLGISKTLHLNSAGNLILIAPVDIYILLIVILSINILCLIIYYGDAMAEKPATQARGIGSFDRTGRIQTVAALERRGAEVLQQMLRSNTDPSLSGCGCANYKCI